MYEQEKMGYFQVRYVFEDNQNPIKNVRTRKNGLFSKVRYIFTDNHNLLKMKSFSMIYNRFSNEGRKIEGRFRT
jgi:hypothetical protein